MRSSGSKFLVPSFEVPSSRAALIRCCLVGKDTPRLQVTQTADMAPRSGKTYFITGAGSGLGEATARMLHSQGANVRGDAANMRFCIAMKPRSIASAAALKCAFARWSGQVALSHKLYTTWMLICSLSDSNAGSLSAVCSLDCQSHQPPDDDLTSSSDSAQAHCLASLSTACQAHRCMHAVPAGHSPMHACRCCMVSSHVTPLPLPCVRLFSASKVGIDFGTFTCACMATASGLRGRSHWYFLLCVHGHSFGTA
jgi:hypothetical protein